MTEQDYPTAGEPGDVEEPTLEALDLDYEDEKRLYKQECAKADAELQRENDWHADNPLDAEPDYERTVTVPRAELEGMQLQLRTAAEVQTESNVSYCKALTDLDEAHREIERVKGIAQESIKRERESLNRLDEFLLYVREVEGQRDALRATLTTVRKTVEEWKVEAEGNHSGLLDAARVEILTLNKVLALLGEEGGK